MSLSCLCLPLRVVLDVVLWSLLLLRLSLPRLCPQADDFMRKKKLDTMSTLRKLNMARAKKGIPPLSKATIYRYVRGDTHKRGVAETRGRKRSLGRSDVKSLDRARRKLIKSANNQHRVTYDAVVSEAGYEEVCCLRTVQSALRREGVRFRQPRRKVYISEVDARERYRVAKQWVRRPQSFWHNNVHAFVDNKAFPVPLTPAQRLKFRQTQITGHLRKPSEGVDKGFTKPRDNHSFLGMPSITISAAIAKDRVIMWHMHSKPWNGSTAADMYQGPLLTALRRTWGAKRRYMIVEDGDRKGNQSGKGIAAKARCNITALTLPPRTPSWMPLDYAVWTAIVAKLVASAPVGKESKADFIARAKACSMSLPRGFIRKTIGRMKRNIQGVIDAGGFHAKND